MLKNCTSRGERAFLEGFACGFVLLVSVCEGDFRGVEARGAL